jgi:hypothetical protein
MRWSDKVVWNCIECTHISNPGTKATPDQIRAEVWMALIHGSRGLIYFVHQFKPEFKEAALLDDAENLAAVTSINHQIQELAAVLNSPTIRDGVKLTAVVKSENAGSPRIAAMQKRLGKSVYLFTVNMVNESVQGSISLASLSGLRSVRVLGEQREISMRQGEFTDEFKPHQVHLYSIATE